MRWTRLNEQFYQAQDGKVYDNDGNLVHDRSNLDGVDVEENSIPEPPTQQEA